MRILGLDLATHTGYAYNDANNILHCGTWSLSIEKSERKQRLNRRNDPRITQLYQHVQVLHALHKFDVVIFEDVQFSSYTLQCQLWSSLRAAAWLGATTARLFEAVPVGKLKLFAAKHGGATKEMMCRALYRSDPRFYKHPENPEMVLYNGREIDDNGVDAVWLWKWAQEKIRL
jgi:hypothetical protein